MSVDFNWDQFEDAPKQSSSFDWDQFEDADPKFQRKKLEKGGRIAAQYGLGLADRALLPLTISSMPLASKNAQHAEFRKGIFEDIERLAEQKASGDWSPQDELLFNELQDQIRNPEKAEKFVKTVDISPSGLIEKGSETLGYNLKPENAAESIGRFAGSFTPKEIASGVKSIPKIIPKSIKKRMPSGLSQPRAVESKLSKFGITSPSGQARSIESLNREASELAKKSVEKHLPISKKIEEGFDFKQDYIKRFGNLKQAAEKYNPEIDITPITNLLTSKIKDYKGIPLLHSEGKKVLAEVRAFNNNPKTSLNNLLKIFRSNNKKRSSIYETAHLSGKQKEYVDFLTDMNSAISESIEKTLPKNSAWVKEFKDLNHSYSQQIKTEKVLSNLAPLIGGKPTPANLEKLAFNKKMHQKLNMSMGKEGANEIIQISKDLQLARKAIQKMPSKELSQWEKLALLGFKIPGTGKVGLAISIFKGIGLSRRALGWLLSRPETRREYSKVLELVAKGDKKGFVSAMTNLKKQLDDDKD